MTQRQFTNPVVVIRGKSSALSQMPFDDRTVFESTLQEILFENPSLLPVGELEPEFEGLVAVARELATLAGPIDLVFVNRLGFITLVETKLWRSPEARRSVVAQIIDYVKEVATWSYEDFAAAVRTARKSTAEDPLAALFDDDPHFDKRAFVDRVSRNLRRGRFLLLIVGDGIRDDVERMAEFLQQAPQFGFSLGLVELAIYRLDALGEGAMLVQPRVVARTREITRAIIEVRGDLKPGDVTVALPDEANRPPARGRIARDDYVEQQEKTAGAEVSQTVRTLLEQAANHQLEVSWNTNGPALEYLDESSGERFPLVRLYKDKFSVGWKKDRLDRWRSSGIPEAVWNDYRQAIAALVPGAKLREAVSDRGNETVMVSMNEGGAKSAGMPLSALVGEEQQFFAAINAAVAKIREAIANRTG